MKSTATAKTLHAQSLFKGCCFFTFYSFALSATFWDVFFYQSARVDGEVCGIMRFSYQYQAVGGVRSSADKGLFFLPSAQNKHRHRLSASALLLSKSGFLAELAAMAG